MNHCLRKTIREIAEVAGHLWTKGWAESNAGNISVDVSHLLPRRLRGHAAPCLVKAKIPGRALAGRSFLVTVAGSRMRDTARSPNKNMLLIKITDRQDGYRIINGEPGWRPTSEFISHLRIHAYLISHKPGFRAVIHTHPVNLTALSHIPDFCNEQAINRILFSMLPEVKIVMPEGIGFADYRCPGTEGLALATARAMRRHRLVIWEKHGVIAAGQNVNEAFDLIDTADKAAGIFLTCLQAGYIPQGLTAGQQAEVEKHFPQQPQRPQRRQRRRGKS